MKKTKLKLDNIKVDSFITTLQDSEKGTIQAGEGSWLLSGCLLSLTCPKAPAPNNQSANWTKAPIVQMCDTGASRDIITQLDPQLCPACARKNAVPIQAEN